MLKVEGATVIFSSGREAYTNGGIIGIDANLEVTHGYDGQFTALPRDPNGPWVGLDLTKEEQAELADYMIGLWTKFKGA
jgi:hypothetical protein